MTTFIENVYNSINSDIHDHPSIGITTYVGKVTHRVQGYHFECEGGHYLRCDDGVIQWQLEDGNKLQDLLLENPLGRVGMVPYPSANLKFLQEELLVWIGVKDIIQGQEPWRLYSDMWNKIPNVSDCAYGKLASSEAMTLESKARCVMCLRNYDDIDCLHKFHDINRTMMLRFPSNSFCPVSWQISFDNPVDMNLTMVLNFRSLEVSRNMLNDLYLAFNYFGYILGLPFSSRTDPNTILCGNIGCTRSHAHLPLVEPTKFDFYESKVLRIKKFVINVGDAHIVDIR